MGVDDVFPGSCGSKVATWFSGQIIPDDLINPNDTHMTEMCAVNDVTPHFVWFDILICKGMVLGTERIDLEDRTIEVRLTNHAARLFDGSEFAFLDAICEAPCDPEPKSRYAAWLEERGDSRYELVRAEVERFRQSGPEARTPMRTMGWMWKDVAVGYVDPEDFAWSWRWLAGIPEPTSRA
jgi:uncharacterized protein (TIGR02996 family)